MTLSSRRHWPALALTLLALAVRLYNLSYHSLWFDEAMSVHWARSDISRIVEVSMNLVEDRLPPLYYLLLHYWRLLVGDGELAVRFPSVLLGTLLVPIVYRLGLDLFRSRRVAVLAAAMAAFNPFLVWYSQEARMYALAVALSALGTWFFLRGVTRRAPAYWVAYGLCALAGLYTHLYTGFLLPAYALYLLLTYRQSRRAWLPFALTMLVVAGLFTPLALATLRASAEAGPGNPLADWGTRAWWLLSAFTVWKAPLSPALGIAIPAILAALAVIGLLGPQRPTVGGRRSAFGPQHPELLLALLLLTPIAIATLLLFRSRVAFFGERYFIVVVPWLLLAVAVGADKLSAVSGQLSAIRRRRSAAGYLLPAVCYLLPLTFAFLPLPGQWSPAARKEAWRETVGYLASAARPEDAILIHPDWTRYPLQYYFRGPGQTYAVFSSVDERTDLDGPLTVISSAHPVVWLVESHTELADPDHRVNGWLAARYPEVTELYPPGLVALRAYAPGYLTERLPSAATPAEAAFAGGLRLAGYTVPQTQVRATDDLFHPPSGWVHATLYWSAAATPSQDCAPFVRLVDDLGQVWGASLERPNDAFDFYPPRRWQPGQVVRADFDVNLNPATPSGVYALVVGLRDATGVQVPLAGGAPQVTLTTIEVVK
jgi:mannosyltransferase